MEASFELFDHTADAGIRVRAATLPELIPPATAGLYACIGELVPSGAARELRFERAASDDGAAVLLRDYLQELLLLFEMEHRVADVVEVFAFSSERLEVVLESRLVDEERSVYYREVKAVTYHELAIRAIEGGVEATLIVDI